MMKTLITSIRTRDWMKELTSFIMIDYFFWKIKSRHSKKKLKFKKRNLKWSKFVFLNWKPSLIRTLKFSKSIQKDGNKTLLSNPFFKLMRSRNSFEPLRRRNPTNVLCASKNLTTSRRWPSLSASINFTQTVLTIGSDNNPRRDAQLADTELRMSK